MKRRCSLWKCGHARTSQSGEAIEPLTFEVLATLGSRIPKGSRRCGCSTLFLGFGSRFSLQLQEFLDLQMICRSLQVCRCLLLLLPSMWISR